MALLGPHLVAGLTDDEDQLDYVLKMAIGFALLLAASTYALRLYINLRRVRGGAPDADPNPRIRPIPTLLVGALGGLLVGITSVGSGSVIMVALLMLYPGLARCGWSAPTWSRRSRWCWPPRSPTSRCTASTGSC